MAWGEEAAVMKYFISPPHTTESDPPSSSESDQHSSRMEKLKEAVIKLFIFKHSSSSSSQLSLTESLRLNHKIKLIEDKIPSFYTALRTTPTHPPYAMMINEAIRDLNEEGGSNMEAISKYIETNYEDLPWAHSHFLKHHLSKLVEIGELISSSTSCYLFPNPNPNTETKTKTKNELEHRRRFRRWKSRPGVRRGTEKQVPEEKFVARTEIIELSSDDNDAVMELGNYSDCEAARGNLVVGTESVGLLCDEDGSLMVSGDSNEVERREEFVGSTDMRRLLCDEDNFLMESGNASRECESRELNKHVAVAKAYQWRNEQGKGTEKQRPTKFFVARSEVVELSGDEDDCLMELDNNRNCGCKGNVETELVQSLCDGVDRLMELGKSSKGESDGNVVLGTELIRSSSEENDGLMDLGNYSDCEPDGNVVVGTEKDPSLCNEVSSLMVLGDSNEVEPIEEYVGSTEVIGLLCDEDRFLVELSNNSRECESEDLNKHVAVAKPKQGRNDQGEGGEEGAMLEWRSHDLGLNQVSFDNTTMLRPVCSCTGVPRQCYKWGKGGWQSACCTLTFSRYPLPVNHKKGKPKRIGRKMTSKTFNKLVSRQVAEGHDPSIPLDLKNHWLRHWRKGYITIKPYEWRNKQCVDGGSGEETVSSYRGHDLSLNQGIFDDSTIPALVSSWAVVCQQEETRPEWRGHELGLGMVNFDKSTIPTPVCSCTGVPRQCYKWGKGGWQSACCTTTLSRYPLPVNHKKGKPRRVGRKMTNKTFDKLVSQLAAEGHDLSTPLDLKNHWPEYATKRLNVLAPVNSCALVLREQEETEAEWRVHDLGLNLFNSDKSTIPAPVCSCTGVLRQCYKWGKKGLQSACCTTTLSRYPLPFKPNKGNSQRVGRKMIGRTFKKILSRLAAEGHDLSIPIDLKDHWTKPRTNNYSNVPGPVCSCTGVRRHCYKWGERGWQSACCTATLSMYPLPLKHNKLYSRLVGRRMSGIPFNKLLNQLVAKGHDLSKPLDLKDHWAKHRRIATARLSNK